MGKFEIKDDFYLNGEPFKIISGAFHYFRTVPEYWEDRLLKLKAMGCNTVETYVPWNKHEEKKGVFNFEGMLDIERFIETATKLGLYIIIRPSPYICAEWEFGGLPGWLLKEDGMRLRVMYKPYIDALTEYLKVLVKKLLPYQIDNGGNIIMMQVENEYGYYGTDHLYLKYLSDLLREIGVTVPFVTSDNPNMENLKGGHLDGALATGNFGSRTKERFAVLKEKVGNAPLMCTEFWVGWFDHWGNGGHMRGNLEQSVVDLDVMLEMGSVNIYMFEGGTNFGFMNGSNYYDALTPDVTSYDYDALLTEDGRITEKYLRYKEVINKHVPVPEVKLLPEIERKAYGTLKCSSRTGLFENLENISTPKESIYTESMERLDQNYGYILYCSKLDTEKEINSLRLWEANDRANVFVGRKRTVTLYDRELLNEVKLSEKDCQNKELAILVENMGRVNFGPRMEHQRKGIDGCVQINGHMHHGYTEWTLPLDNIEKIDFNAGYTQNLPAFHKFTFEVKEGLDTFLELKDWGKGCVFINGFNLGRFWEIGPQKRLYIPGPLIKEGVNEIVVFETEGKYTDYIELCDEPDLG